MDLCVSCKGCKRDCPTGVDMARMKIEVKSARRMAKGLELARPADRRPAGDGAVGAAHAVAVQPRRGSCSPISASPSSARLPQLARRYVPGDDRGRRRRCHGGDLRRHLLEQFRARDPACRAARAGGGGPSRRRRLADARRARAVLRPHLSRDRPGREGQARRRCALLQALVPFVAKGVPVVGLEPSCLFTLRDEFLAMGLGEDAEPVAEECLPVRGVPGAREEGGPARARAQAAGREEARCCTAIATRRRSAR